MNSSEPAPNVIFRPVLECNCPNDCVRHGHCEECRAYHAHARRPRPPFCERPAKVGLLTRLFR